MSRETSLNRRPIDPRPRRSDRRSAAVKKEKERSKERALQRVSCQAAGEKWQVARNGTDRNGTAVNRKRARNPLGVAQLDVSASGRFMFIYLFDFKSVHFADESGASGASRRMGTRLKRDIDDLLPWYQLWRTIDPRAAAAVLTAITP